MIRRFLLLTALFAIATTPAKAADIIYPNTGASLPSAGNVGVLVEQGRKGILLTMQCLNSSGVPQNDCWPLATVSPSLSIAGGASIACALGLNPAANACGYAIGAFTAADPNVDTFKIVYNGNFPSNASVAVTVTGATGNAGSSEPASVCPDAGDPGCTLSFAVGANTPRANTNTELVFDISGSMALPATGTQPNPTPTRITALQGAADAFLQVYQQHTMLGDKLAAVVFSTAASSLTPGTPNFVSGFDPTQVNTKVQGPIDSQIPTNSTAIGDGLSLASTNGFAADGSTNTKWVILFTDGEQNIPPPSGNVSATTGPTSQVSIGGTTYSTGTNKFANAGQITICPITAGLQTSNGFTLQQAIADALCNSQNGYVGAVPDFITYFGQLFTTILKGDKLEISRDIASTVTATPSVTFLGNTLDRSFEIILTYAPQAERAGYRLMAPDGTVLPIAPHRFAGGSVAKVELPVVIGKKRLSSRGQWKVILDPETFGNAPAYHLMVINDNPTIATTFTTLGTDLGTGDPLQVQATVLDKGKPPANATVTVDVDGPNFGLGNVLSTTAVQGSLPDLHGDNAGPAGAQKLLILANNPDNGKFFGTSPRPPVKLQYCKPGPGQDHNWWRLKWHRVHDWWKVQPDCERTFPIRAAMGEAPLAAAAALPGSGGVYTGTFTNSALEGHYFFTFHASGTSAGNGPFQRTWKVALFVRPKPYGPKTPVLVESIGPNQGGDTATGGLVATLRVTPHDKLGNFIGPGYDGALDFVNGSTPFPFTTDNLDGSYEFVRITTAPGNSKLTLRTLGQPVKTIDLAGAKPGQTL